MDITAPVTDYIKGSTLVNEWDIIVMGATEPLNLAKGANSTILTVDPITGNIKWLTIITALRSQFSQRGCLMTYFNNDVRRLSVGSINQVLSNDGYDLVWKSALQTLLTLLTTRGDIIKRGVTYAERLAIGAALQVLQVNAGGTEPEYVTPYWIENALLTTEGDIIIRGDTIPERLAKGSANQILSVDPSGTTLIYKNEHTVLTTQGDIVKRGAAAPERLARGTAKQVLAVNDAGTDLEYRDAAGLGLDTEYSVANGAQVNLLLADTSFLTLNIGTRATGARLMITIYVNGTKDSTQGHTYIKLKKNSGTGAIEFAHNKFETHWARGIGANENVAFTVSVVGKVTTGGTLVLELYGSSAGSNFVVTAGNAQVYALVLKG